MPDWSEHILRIEGLSLEVIKFRAVVRFPIHSVRLIPRKFRVLYLEYFERNHISTFCNVISPETITSG
jgi:hypothetical protein